MKINKAGINKTHGVAIRPLGILLPQTLCALLLTGTCQAALADVPADPTFSPWLVTAGASLIAPKSDNGHIVPGDVSISNHTGFSLNASYFFTPNWAVNLLGGLPFRHHIAVDGGAIGHTEDLPPTLSVQYHFLPDAKIQPFVGAGINYTLFRHETLDNGANLKLSGSWGPTAQVGVLVPIDRHWTVDADVRWVDIVTRAGVNGSDLGKVYINPFVYSLQVGYRF